MRRRALRLSRRPDRPVEPPAPDADGVTRVTIANETAGDSMLCVYVEPLANDYWIAPGQRLSFEARMSEPDLDVIWHNDVTIWMGDADPLAISVKTEDGVEVDCGFQRPDSTAADELT